MTSDLWLATARLKSDRDQLTRIILDIERSGLEAESEAESIGEVASSSQHQADVATETFERERDLSVLHDLRTQVREIDAALERLTSGTYGLCQTCGRQIDAARMTAVPATRYCIADEERAERAALFGTERAPEWMGGLVADSGFLASDDEPDEADDVWGGPEADAVGVGVDDVDGAWTNARPL